MSKKKNTQAWAINLCRYGHITTHVLCIVLVILSEAEKQIDIRYLNYLIMHMIKW